MDKANLPALFFLSLLILSRPRALFCTFPSFSTAIDSPDFHQWISVNVAMNELNIQTAVAKWTAKRFSYRIINAHCAVCYVARWRRQFIFLPLGNNFQQNDWSCYNKLGELWAGIINQAFRSGCALIWIRKKKEETNVFSHHRHHQKQQSFFKFTCWFKLWDCTLYVGEQDTPAHGGEWMDIQTANAMQWVRDTTTTISMFTLYSHTWKCM